MLLIYNFLILLSLIISSPFLLFKIWQKKELSFLCTRLGILPAGRIIFSDKLVWFHAASVGEINGIYPIIRDLLKRDSSLELIITTYTSQGLKRANEIFSVFPVIFSAILPIDFGPVIKRFLKRIHPKVLVISETELWPSLIEHAKKENIRIVVVNGRISDKTYSKYYRFRFFFKKVLKNIDFYCAQTEKDKERVISLGMQEGLIEVCGNAKYSILPETKKEIELNLSKPVIVSGSTRPGEEEIILAVFKNLSKIFPDASLIIAPRHMERIAEIEKIVQRTGISYILRTKILSNEQRAMSNESRETDQGLRILILDTIGELNTFYKSADVAFVGGTLAQYGGHNLLEPAAFKKPVIFGPFIDNVRDIAEDLEKSSGGIEVKNADELERAFVKILSDEKTKIFMGGSAYNVFLKNSGSALRQREIIEKYIH